MFFSSKKLLKEMTLIYLSGGHKLQNVKNVGMHEKYKSQIKTRKIFDPPIVNY